MTMRKILKSRKGMTLIELTIGLVVFSIIILAVSATLTPTLRAYYNATELAEVNNLLDSLSAELLSDAAGAKTNFAGNSNLSVSGSPGAQTLTIGPVSYSVDASGVLQRRGSDGIDRPVLDAGFYKNKQLTVDYTLDEIPGSPVTLTVRMTLTRTGGSLLAARDYTVVPIGLRP